MQPKNELCEHIGSKQAKYYRKAGNTQDSWEGGEEPPHCLIGVFNPLKMGGYQLGVQKDVVFSHWPYPITYISLCPIGVLG